MQSIKTFKTEEPCKDWANFLVSISLPARVARLAPTYGGDEDTDQAVANLVKAYPYGLFVDVPKALWFRVSEAIRATVEADVRIKWNLGEEKFQEFKRELFDHHVRNNQPLLVPSPKRFFTLRLQLHLQDFSSAIIDSKGWAVEKSYIPPLYDWVRLWEAAAGEKTSIPEPPESVPSENPPETLTAEQVMHLVKTYKPTGMYANFDIEFQGGQAITLNVFDKKRVIWVSSSEPTEQPTVLTDEMEQEIISTWGNTLPIVPMEHQPTTLHFIK